jgi:heme exporter protein B
MRFWGQALEVARVDFRIEAREGEVIRIVMPFAVMALLVFPLAMGLDLSTLERIGPAVFWALGVLFGMQVALRQSAEEAVSRKDLYALAGLDPAARFAGRALSGTLLTIGFFAALWLGMVVVYSPGLPAGWPGPTAMATALVAIGLTELGTLAGEVTAGLRNRTALASLIVAPLAVPLVVGGSQTMDSLARDESILPWVLLLLATDLALAVAGVGLARPLEEASR